MISKYFYTRMLCSIMDIIQTDQSDYCWILSEYVLSAQKNDVEDIVYQAVK